MERERKIDSVKMMHQIRDRLSKVFGQMTFEEQKEYMTKNRKNITIKRRLTDESDKKPDR